MLPTSKKQGRGPGAEVTLLLLVFLVTGCARAQVVPTPPVSGTAAVAGAPLAIPHAIPIVVGEELEYQVAWWGVPVGTVLLRVASEEDKTFGWSLKLTCQGRSNKTLDAFYPVRVELNSLLDPETHSPRQARAFVKRRWRQHESVITFDPVKKTAFHQLPKGRTATVPIGPQTQDGLSLLYYARSLDFQVGQSIPLEVTADGKNWHLNGKIVRLSTVKLKLEEEEKSWPAVEGTAELAYPVPFFQGAKARIWFSDDAERIPLLAKIRSRIGPVTVVLTRRPNH